MTSEDDNDVFEDSQEDWETLLDNDNLKPVVEPEPPKQDKASPAVGSKPSPALKPVSPLMSSTNSGQKESHIKKGSISKPGAAGAAAGASREKSKSDPDTGAQGKKNETVVGGGIVIQVNNTEKPRVPHRGSDGGLQQPSPEKLAEARMAAYYAMKNIFGRELNPFEQNALSASLDAFRSALFGAPQSQMFPHGQGGHGGLLQSPTGHPHMMMGHPHGSGGQHGRYAGANSYSNQGPPPPPIQRGEGAWAPSSTPGGSKVSENERIRRVVTSILNKLTMDNFDQLMEQIKNVGIKKAEHLEELIRIVFDKALSESHFCTIYATLCSRLSHLDIKPEDPSKTGGRKLTFRRLLLNRCQTEFEAETSSTLVAECKDAAEKEAIARKLRKRHLGLVIFIGELFKQEMLHENIMHECVVNLLGTGEDGKPVDDDSLECLCKLLTTAGKLLEKKPESMDVYFARIKALSKDKKVSSRVRFALRDVMELRSNHWRPRRIVEGPKKVEDVRAEARAELIRRGERPPSDKNLTPLLSTVQAQQAYNGGVGMAMVPPGQMMAQRHSMGPMAGPFSGPQGGRHPSNQSPILSPTGGPAMHQGMGPILFAPPTVGHNPQMGVGRDGRKGGLMGGKPGLPGGPRDRSVSLPMAPGAPVSDPASARTSGTTSPVEDVAPPPPPFKEEEMQEKSEIIVKEYATSLELEDAIQNVKDLVVSEKHGSSFITNVLVVAIDIKASEREVIGEFFFPAICVEGGPVTIVAFEEGLKEVLSMLDDLILDVGPRTAVFLAEVLCKVVVEDKRIAGVLPRILKELGTSISPFLLSLFQLIRSRHDEATAATVLHSSNLSIDALFDEEKRHSRNMAAVLGKHDLLFLAPFVRLATMIEEAVEDGKDGAAVVAMIEECIPERSRSSVRLVQCTLRPVLELIVKKGGEQSGGAVAKVEKEVFDMYVDSVFKLFTTGPMKMECLHEVHRFCMGKDWPEGLMERMFSWLYNGDIVPEEAFIVWKDDTSDVVPQKGKALFQVNRFIHWLQTADEESD